MARGAARTDHVGADDRLAVAGRERVGRAPEERSRAATGARRLTLSSSFDERSRSPSRSSLHGEARPRGHRRALGAPRRPPCPDARPPRRARKRRVGLLQAGPPDTCGSSPLTLRVGTDESAYSSAGAFGSSRAPRSPASRSGPGSSRRRRRDEVALRRARARPGVESTSSSRVSFAGRRRRGPGEARWPVRSFAQVGAARRRRSSVKLAAQPGRERRRVALATRAGEPRRGPGTSGSPRGRARNSRRCGRPTPRSSA